MNHTRQIGRIARRQGTAAAATLVFLSSALHAASVEAIDFRSTAENGVVLYDGPSAKARRIFVATRSMPVEIISTDGTWVKVRDVSGDLAWVERKSLSDRRFVVVTAQVADVRQRPDEAGPLAFQAAQGVGLEYVDQSGTPPGWIRVRHPDGSSGYVRISQIWGV